MDAFAILLLLIGALVGVFVIALTDIVADAIKARRRPPPSRLALATEAARVAADGILIAGSALSNALRSVLRRR